MGKRRTTRKRTDGQSSRNPFPLPQEPEQRKVKTENVGSESTGANTQATQFTHTTKAKTPEMYRYIHEYFGKSEEDLVMLLEIVDVLIDNKFMPTSYWDSLNGTRGWVHNRAIDHALSFIRNDTIYNICSDFGQPCLQKVYDPSAHSLERLALPDSACPPKDAHKFTIIFLPLSADADRWGEHHHYLAVFRPKHARIDIYDTLGVDRREDCQHLVTMANDYMPLSPSSHKRWEKKNIRMAACPRQNAGWDCGILVYAMAEAIAKAPEEDDIRDYVSVEVGHLLSYRESMMARSLSLLAGAGLPSNPMPAL